MHRIDHCDEFLPIHVHRTKQYTAEQWMQMHLSHTDHVAIGFEREEIRMRERKNPSNAKLLTENRVDNCVSWIAEMLITPHIHSLEIQAANTIANERTRIKPNGLSCSYCWFFFWVEPTQKQKKMNREKTRRKFAVRKLCSIVWSYTTSSSLSMWYCECVSTIYTINNNSRK